nr:hypothetical protein [Tanacetum cinerariifolium]
MSQPLRNQSVVRQPTAFKSERPRISKPREAAPVKPHHMIASSNSRISSMTRFSSNDMVHNYYLEEAKKRTQERTRNSKPSLIPSARSKSTAMPRRNTQTSRNWPASKNSFVTTKTVPIAEHPMNSRNDSCVTNFLKEVNSRAKVPSKKTTNINKPIEQIGVPNKQERQIPTGHRYIFQSERGRTQSLGAEKIDISLTRASRNFYLMYKITTSDHNSSELGLHDHSNEQSSSKLVPNVVPPADKTATSRQELELLFHHHITMLRSYALSWKPCQGDSLNLPDHRFQVYQGRLLTSFQDDAKYKHGGQDTRLQGGNDNQDEKDKDLKISNEKTKSKDNYKWRKIKDHEA